MIWLPEEVQSIDDLCAFLLRHLTPEDQFRVMRMLQEYETEVRTTFLWLGRREILCELRTPHEN